jgi:hypothetical protein
MTLLTNMFEEEQFLAGEYVAPGTYQQAGTNRSVHFDNAGYLPGTIEGAMCKYFRIDNSVDNVESSSKRPEPARGNTWMPTSA